MSMMADTPAETEPEFESNDGSGSESEEDDGPKLQLADIGTFSAQGGEITMRMEPVKTKKKPKKKKKKAEKKEKDDCECKDKPDCPELSNTEIIPDADLDTILARYAAIFDGKPNGIDELLYFQRCPVAHAEEDVLKFARGQLIKVDMFPDEDTLPKKVDRLITLVSSGLVPGLIAVHEGKSDKRGCETIRIIQEHGAKPVKAKKPEKKKPEKKEGDPGDGCCKKACDTAKEYASCAPCRSAVSTCVGTLLTPCKAVCGKKDINPDDVVKTGFPNFHLTEKQVNAIALKLDEEDQSGFLEASEIHQLGIWMRYRLSNAQLETACEELGVSGDTGVSFDKFGKWLNSKSKVAFVLRKSLYPQDLSVPKYLAKSPFATQEQIELLIQWIEQDNLDKSGEIEHEKLNGVASMDILQYAKSFVITPEEVAEMMVSLNMNDAKGERLNDSCSNVDFAPWVNGNDVLAWKFRSILPFVEPKGDAYFPYNPSKPGAEACHGKQEWTYTNACCVPSFCCFIPVMPRSNTPYIAPVINTVCAPLMAPCCIHHIKETIPKPLQPPSGWGQICGFDCFCWHATCTWYPKCIPLCGCCNEESIDGSPATYCTKASFFQNEEIDIFDGEMVAWEAPTEKKVNDVGEEEQLTPQEAPGADMER